MRIQIGLKQRVPKAGTSTSLALSFSVVAQELPAPRPHPPVSLAVSPAYLPVADTFQCHRFNVIDPVADVLLQSPACWRSKVDQLLHGAIVDARNTHVALLAGRPSAARASAACYTPATPGRRRRILRTPILFALVLLALAACESAPPPDIDATVSAGRANVEAAAQATIDASVAATTAVQSSAPTPTAVATTVPVLAPTPAPTPTPTPSPTPTPTLAARGGADFVQVSGAHTCALRADGSVVCWGDDEFGQLRAPADERFTAIAAGGSHTCGLRLGGPVRSRVPGSGVTEGLG